MMRFLFFVPLLGALGLIFALYSIFFKPIIKDAQGNSQTFSQAMDSLKEDINKIKSQQDTLLGIISTQKDDLIAQAEKAAKLSQQINQNDFNDVDLVSLKESIDMFNHQALDLAGNETAIIAFNDQLKSGIAALETQIRSIDMMEILKPKSDVGPRLDALKIQVAKLTEVQKQIIEKSKEYNLQSKEISNELKIKLQDHAQAIANSKSDKAVLVAARVNDFVNAQKDIVIKANEQAMTIDDMRQQNAQQVESAKERVQRLVGQLKDRMEEAKDRAQQAKDKVQDSQDKMIDARAKAEEARQRTKDLQQMLKDRR